MRDINLLPEDIKMNPKDARENTKGNADSTVEANKEKGGKKAFSKVKGIFFAVVVIIIVCGSLAGPKAYMSQLDRTSENLDKAINDPKYNETNQVNRQLSELNNVMGVKKTIINDIDKMSYPMTEVFTAMRNACPKGCYITNLDYNGSQIRISGYASDTLLAAEFMSNLDSLEHLSKNSSTENFAVEKANASTQFSFTYDVGKEGE